MAHSVHGVVRLVAMEWPVTRIIGNELDRADGSDRNVARCLRLARGFRHPAAIGTGYREVATMQMDRMIGHGQIPHAHTDTVIEAHKQRVDASEDSAVPRPHVEVRNNRDLGQIGPDLCRRRS
jgi:hypothetical protein